MTKPRLTAEGAREIRAISAVMPGLKWVTCRICLEMCPSDLIPGIGNRHATCDDGPKVAAERRDWKSVNPDQGLLV